MKYILILLAGLAAFTLYAQYSPGELAFTYYNVPADPYSISFGTAGAANTMNYTDIGNPASFLNSPRNASFSYYNHIGQTHMGFIKYNDSKMNFSIKYFNSGTMEKRDSLDNYLGDFLTNTAIIRGTYAFEVNQNINAGVGISAGIENIDEFNQYAGGVDAGIIYKGFKNYFNAGFYINAGGVSYNENGIKPLPARIILGLGIENEELPIRLYIDGGVILDRSLFYAGGLEVNVLKLQNIFTEPEVKIENTVSEMKDVPDDDMGEVSAEIETGTESENETEYFSYADYLESLDKKETADTSAVNDEMTGDAVIDETETDSTAVAAEENLTDGNYAAETELIDSIAVTEHIESKGEPSNDKAEIENEESIIQKPVNKPVKDNFEFLVRAGVNSDKSDLMLGTSLDIIAGFSAGFSMRYSNITIDYAAKFWGELGIGHSVGIRMGF